MRQLASGFFFSLRLNREPLDSVTTENAINCGVTRPSAISREEKKRREKEREILGVTQNLQVNILSTQLYSYLIVSL